MRIRTMLPHALLLMVLTTLGCATSSPLAHMEQPAAGLPVFGSLPALSVFQEEAGVAEPYSETSWSGVGWTALMYIPNRILDILDVVRAKLRLGPGFAIGAQATSVTHVYVGTYFTVFIGLPGPRQRKMPKLPVGVETRTGAQLSKADVTLEGGLGPDYGRWEFALSFQLAIIGADLGLDPYEFWDFLAGLATYDPAGDDF